MAGEIMTRGGMRAVMSRRELSAFIIILLIGVLHRQRITVADHAPAADPAWLGEFSSSPHWHWSLAGGLLITRALTRYQRLAVR